MDPRPQRWLGKRGATMLGNLHHKNLLALIGTSELRDLAKKHTVPRLPLLGADRPLRPVHLLLLRSLLRVILLARVEEPFLVQLHALEASHPESTPGPLRAVRPPEGFAGRIQGTELLGPQLPGGLQMPCL